MIKKKSYSFSAQPSSDSLKFCVVPQGYTLHACPCGPHGINSGVDLNQWTGVSLLSPLESPHLLSCSSDSFELKNPTVSRLAHVVLCLCGSVWYHEQTD